MRTLLRWLVVTLGVAALVRWLRRRGKTAAPPPAETVDDPAEELRRRLAESRALEPEPAPAPDASVAERRSEVHAQGRAALSEMTSSDDEG